MNKSIDVINYYTEVKFPCLEEVGLEMNVNKCVMQIWNWSTKNKQWLLVIKKKGHGQIWTSCDFFKLHMHIPFPISLTM